MRRTEYLTLDKPASFAFHAAATPEEQFSILIDLIGVDGREF